MTGTFSIRLLSNGVQDVKHMFVCQFEHKFFPIEEERFVLELTIILGVHVNILSISIISLGL